MKGKKEGKIEGKLELALELLKDGMSLEKVAKYSKLSLSMSERTPAYRGGSFLLQREQRH